MLKRLSLSAMLLSLLISSSALASNALVFSGVADCGWAQDWPRDREFSMWNENCRVSLSLLPTERFTNGTSSGDVEWQISDMIFVGRYFRSGSTIEIYFNNAEYRGPRIVSYSTGRLRRPATIGISVPVGGNYYRNITLTQVN